MGIMITYGSYVKPEVDLGKSVSMIEVMDTGVALLAGVMIIPAVYVFFGVDGMAAGPGLMFISLPKVFYRMGVAGRIIGLLFFVLAAFAALTSCISVLESITAVWIFSIQNVKKQREFFPLFIWLQLLLLHWVIAFSMLRLCCQTEAPDSCWILWTTSATVL